MSERSSSGALLTFAALLAFAGGALYGLGGANSERSPLLFVLTRNFILVAVLMNALGLALLEGLLRRSGEYVLSRLGFIAFLLGAAMVVVTEALLLDGRGFVAPLVRLYVVLAFLSQAAYGGLLLLTRLLPAWVGWATLIWNLGWLAMLLAVNVENGPGYYYPVLHHVAPLLIGIELLRLRPAPGQHGQGG